MSLTTDAIVKQFPSVKHIHDAFDSKKLSVFELTQSFLKSASESRHNAYITLCPELALEQARAAQVILEKEKKVPREKLPLLGIPLGIKDLIHRQGVRTTCASKVLENYIPPFSATAVSRLESAGAIVLGKLNLDEFGMGGSNENSAFGPVIHPTHPDRVPGGSSGGSACAVRASLCFGALGTDTGGSVRLPASYCGIVGLKPTYGRVSRYGLTAFASSLDQIGPMSRTVEDAALMLDVLSGHDPLDSTSDLRGATQARIALSREINWSAIRIGVPKEYFVEGLSAEVQSSIEKSLQWFESRGAKLVPVSLPLTPYVISVYYLIAVSEASSNLARFDGVRYGVRPLAADHVKDLREFYMQVRGRFGAEVKRRIILGTFALSSGYADDYYRLACQVRRKMTEDLQQAFRSVDFIASPVAPTTAYRIGEKSQDPLQMYLNDIYTIPANLAGLPALSIPCGQDRDGLPIGLQLMAPHFQEEPLLAVGHALEQWQKGESFHAS